MRRDEAAGWRRHLDTPALVVDRAVLERNLATMAGALRQRGVALRPHFKTHKTVEVARLQRERGAVGITCATLGEAAVLADAGFDDVFVAYPVWPGGPKAGRLRAVHERTRLTVGVDSSEGAGALGAAMRGAPTPLRVFVEVDAGGRRTGAPPGDAGAVAVAAERAGLDVAGVFTHGGHSYAPGEAPQRAAREEVEGLTAAVESLGASGVQVRVVSAGSTPTAVLSAGGVVTEERPGTYVFGDRQQVVIGSCRSEDVALTVAATVVSRAVAGQVVLDAGTKCLGREIQPWLSGYGYLPEWPHVAITRLYDHHGVGVVEPGQPAPEVGEVVTVVPNHVCPVVNLAEELVVVEDGGIVDRWAVAARARV